MLVELFLREERLGLPVTQVAGRGTDEFGDFVAVLELRAINLNDRAHVAKKHFRRGFDQASLSGTRGPEKQ